MIYGYARVSTNQQSADSQVEQLRLAGAETILRETVSGARADRKQLRKLLTTLAPGDQVVVTRLDRLARSTSDLLQILEAINKASAGFRSLAEPWADTSSPVGELMVTIIGALATWERRMIRERIDEGRARAKAAGRSLGRKSSLKPDQIRYVLGQRAAGVSTREIARVIGCSASTISRLKPASIA